MRDVYNAPAILLIGNDPTEEHPLLAWQIRNNVRLHSAKLYVVNANPIKLRQAGDRVRARLRRKITENSRLSCRVRVKTARAAVSTGAGCGSGTMVGVRDKLRAEKDLVIIFGSEILGASGSGSRKICRECLRREVDLPGRLRELAGRSRHGSLSRSASRILSGFRSGQSSGRMGDSSGQRGLESFRKCSMRRKPVS